MFNIREETLTPREVEAATGFTVATLATWRSRGRGPAYRRIMGRIYYPKADLAEWVQAQMNGEVA